MCMQFFTYLDTHNLPAPVKAEGGEGNTTMARGKSPLVVDKKFVTQRVNVGSTILLTASFLEVPYLLCICK